MLNAFLAMVSTPEQKVLVERLYNNYEQIIFGVALGILKNVQDAEDAVQETFKWVIENIDELKFDFERQTFALLTVIARHICIDKFRRRATENEYLSEYVDQNDDLSVIDDLSEVEVNELLKSLPEDIMQVVTLRYVAGYDIKFIAKVLNVTERTIFRRITRAKEIIKKRMEENYV